MVVAAVSVIATVVIAWAVQQVGRKQREADDSRGRRRAMTEAHVRLTTGEVAQARHLAEELAGVRAGKCSRLLRARRSDYVAAFYALVWAIESIANLRRTWTSGFGDGSRSDFLRWNEDAIHADINVLYEALVRDDPAFRTRSRDAWASVADARKHVG